MSSQLFSRAIGSTGPQILRRVESSRLLQSLGPASEIWFDGKDGPSAAGDFEKENIWAHQAGVNCLAVDRFEGR